MRQEGKGRLKWGAAVLALALLFVTGNCVTGTVRAESGTVAAAAKTAEETTEKTVKETAEENTASEYTGWRTKNKKKYYYVNGEKITGWRKISGKYYFFDENGKLQTNQIVGTKKSGYYYVDDSGVRVTSKEMKMAVAFIRKNTKNSDSKSQKLKKCYKALGKNPYKRFYSDEPTAKKIPSYAKYMFNNKCGNCYRYASAMAYIAKALGYEVRVAVGGVTAHGKNASLSPHGWCEIKTGSSWKMLDVSMQKHHSSAKLYLVTRSQYPYRLRTDKVYKMKIKKGKISWS